MYFYSDWRDLSVEQEKYLVQIRPPGDVITMSIRTLVSTQNITSAAVLYDDTFGKGLAINDVTRLMIIFDALPPSSPKMIIFIFLQKLSLNP